MILINKVYNLIGYWDNDTWDLANCGIKNIEDCIKYRDTSYRYIEFNNIKNQYIKKEIKLYIFNTLASFKGDLAILRESHLRLFKWFINYLETIDYKFTSLTNINKDFLEDYIGFLQSKNICITYNKGYICRNKLARFPIKIQRYYIDLYNKTLGKSEDTWYIDNFNISSHRINLSSTVKTIKFYDVTNNHNKEIFKRYIKYLLVHTQISLSFICTKHNHIKKFLLFIDKKNLEDLDRKDIEQYKENLLSQIIDSRTYNVYLLSILGLFEFGVENKLWQKSHIYTEVDLIDSSLKINGNIVDHYVIRQILNSAEKIPMQYLCMLLLMYCCGMRISEVCILTINCLKRDEKGFYIVFYQQKIKQEVTNPIPKNLYSLLQEHKAFILKEYSENQKYLFPRKGGNPMLSNTYRSKMKDLFKELNIKTIDGKDYIFRPHEYRHTFATNLIERDIPFTIVQKLLHHNSPEMSLVYTQINDSRKRKKYFEFIDIVGKKSNKLFENKDESEKLYEIEWIKKNLKAQALPNGYCSLPISLGKCPYANMCLKCSHFKTTKAHIEILKKQLTRTEILIEALKENNQYSMVNENIMIKENLQRIIDTLEEGVYYGES